LLSAYDGAPSIVKPALELIVTVLAPVTFFTLYPL